MSNDKMREAFEEIKLIVAEGAKRRCINYEELEDLVDKVSDMEAALSQQPESDPVAFAKDGNLFWHGDPTEKRGVNCDLFASPQPSAQVPEGRADEIVTQLYRRFKDWSKRGFGPDDVTWCEVKANVIELLTAAPSIAEKDQ